MINPPKTQLGTSVLALSAAIGITIIAGIALGQGSDSDEQRYRLEVPLQNHLQLGMNEQDVFIEREADSGEAYRVTAADADPAAPLFASAVPTDHNPADAADIGPFGRGAPLGISQGEWLEGSGHALITCDGDVGSVQASFEDLVPQGVYTLWYFFMPMPFAEPFSTYDLPLAARDGSQNTFVTDEHGDARVEIAVEPCLQLSGRQLTAGLAAAYHSDGRTYGSSPGDFGTVSHLHVFNFLPAEADASTR